MSSNGGSIEIARPLSYLATSLAGSEALRAPYLELVSGKEPKRVLAK